MIDANHLLFTREGTLASAATRVLAQTGPYDHCNMTVTDAGPAAALARFKELLLAMDYGDPEVRSLLDLEGLKQWKDGRTSGYAALEAEIQTIDQYVKRRKQAEATGEYGLAAEFDQIISDETNHRDELQQMLARWP